jgi:hypothetical protein
MKVVGVKGLGVINEDDVKEIWCHNFKLKSGKCIYRVRVYFFEEGDEDVEYFYIKDDVLDSKFRNWYCEVDDENNYIKVNQKIIDEIEEVYCDLEDSDEIDFMCDSGFSEVDEEELNELLGR